MPPIPKTGPQITLPQTLSMHTSYYGFDMYKQATGTDFQDQGAIARHDVDICSFK